jgi:hypothetical protein
MGTACRKGENFRPRTSCIETPDVQPSAPQQRCRHERDRYRSGLIVSTAMILLFTAMRTRSNSFQVWSTAGVLLT